MSSVVLLPVEELRRRDDVRRLDDEKVAWLAESIQEVGLLSPIVIRRTTPPFDGADQTERFEIVAGSHRFAACDSLAWRTIPCMEIELDDDLHAELAMIDENLMRAELSASERAMQTARRKVIYEDLHPETKHGGDRKSDQVDNLSTRSFASETAKAIGKDERTIRRDAERGERIAPQVLGSIAGTKLDKGVYLDKLKKLPADEQAKAVERDIAAPQKPAARKPIAIPPAASHTDVFAAFIQHADSIETLPIPDLISASGRQRSILGQRASGLADRMIEIVERLDQ